MFNKLNLFKIGKALSVVGAFIVSTLTAVTFSMYSSYNTLVCLHAAIYENKNDNGGIVQEVISRSFLFDNIVYTWSIYQTCLIITVVLFVIFVILIGASFLMGYINSNNSKKDRIY